MVYRLCGACDVAEKQIGLVRFAMVRIDMIEHTDIESIRKPYKLTSRSPLICFKLLEKYAINTAFNIDLSYGAISTFARNKPTRVPSGYDVVVLFIEITLYSIPNI
jgi:hypothetical protein